MERKPGRLLLLPTSAKDPISVSLAFYTVSYSYLKGEPSALRLSVFQASFYDELTDFLVTLTTRTISDSELFIS